MLRSGNRAGIVIISGNEWCFGLDNEYHTLMDFGGHLESNETEIEAAIREAKEESFGLLNFSEDELVFTPNIKTTNSKIYFLSVSINKRLFYDDFMKEVLFARMKGNRIESSGIIWLNENEVKNYLSFPNLWYSPVYDAVYKYFYS